MLIVSLVASRAGVMQYSLYPRGLECIIKGVPFVTFGRKGIGPRIPRIGPPQTKLCQVTPPPPTPTPPPL